jgi:hypothetical protein
MPIDQQQPIVPGRLRRIDGSFGFIPHRFLRDGFLRSLTSDELRLYIMLVLVADRQGISFYSHQRLCSELDMSTESYLAARDGLSRKDLIAANGVRVQVLSLPPEPVVVEARAMDREQRVSACRTILATLANADRK